MDGGQAPSPRLCYRAAQSLWAAAAILSWACAGPSSVVDPPPRYIAHAGGIGNHRTYTNSLEALNNSVARGHTAIEIDFSWTSDDHLVLVHDWDREFERLFDRLPGRLTLAEFRLTPSAYGLTHLILEDLESWLLDNPEVLVITDIKERNTEGLRLIAEEYPEHRHRFVPQIYRPESYIEVRELGYDHVVFSLYRTDLSDRQVIEFAIANPLFGVTMPVRRAREGTLPAELAANGVRVFVHTVNDYPTANGLRTEGVYGVYTDWLSPDDERFSRPLAEWSVRTEGKLSLDHLVVPFFPWEMAGLDTVVDFRNTSSFEETVRLHILDSAGRSLAMNEFEISGDDEKQLDLKGFVSNGSGQGWLLIEASDEIVVRPRWRFLDSSEGEWTMERIARTRFETGGSGSGLGGLLVAVVNPTHSIQSYRLHRLVGTDAIDDDDVDLEPGHQLLRVYRSRTEEDIQLSVIGGPMVTQVVRWDPSGRFMR
jgi:glycerophosphoryl diester phosphodiesterase